MALGNELCKWKLALFGVASLALALAGLAETAVVRVGYTQGKSVRYEARTVELEQTGDASWRFVMPKASILLI